MNIVPRINVNVKMCVGPIPLSGGLVPNLNYRHKDLTICISANGENVKLLM